MIKQLAGWRWGKAWVTNVVLCLLGYALVMMARQFVSETDHFTIGMSGASGWSAVLYLAAVVVVVTQPVDEKTIWIVLGWAVAMRGMTLFEPSYLSSDIYRYVWDGVVQHAGVNPYRYVPGDHMLAWLRAPNQEIFDNINRREYARTIYPPVAQLVFWLATFFEPTVQGMKAAMFVFECITAAALVSMLRRMGRPIAQVLVYAWCPLLVWEIAGSGHVDAAVYAFVALALLFRFRNQPGWVGFFLGCAVMTKFYPLVLVPALWRKGDWKMPAALLSVCAAGYALYLSVGKLVFGFLFEYGKEEGIDTGSRFFLLEWVHTLPRLGSVSKGLYLAFCVVVLGAIAVWCWRYAAVEVGLNDGAVELGGSQINYVRSYRSSPAFVKGAIMLALAMMLLFSPHYPWYVAWLVPLMTLWVNWPTVVYVCAFFYGFTTMWADGSGPHMLFLNKWIYGLVLLAMVMQFAWSKLGLRAWIDCRGRVDV